MSSDEKRMRCLSVRQPWAWLLVQGIKDVENRTWKTTYLGPLLIHASTILETAAYKQLQRRGYSLPSLDELPRGSIIGTVEIVEYVWSCRRPVKMRQSIWHDPGYWGWYVANPQRFLVSIPYRGQQGVFRVPKDVLP